MPHDRTRHDAAAPGWGATGGPASTEALVDALGMAFATFTLYDDPTGETAFARAVETLGRAHTYPWRIETGVDGFLSQGELVAARREGSLRVARRLFSLGIAAIDVVAPPSPGDLLALFDLLGPETGEDEARKLLAARGVTSVRLLDRAMLLGGETPPDDDTATRAAAIGTDHPAAFVLAMLSDGSAEPADVALQFVEEYERAHLLVDLDDTWGMEELIHAFVEGFSYLPEAHRAAIFSLLLQRGHRPENTAFLDQLSGLEIAELDRMFGSDGHPLLAEYLRVAGEEGGRPTDRLARDTDRSRPLGAQIVDQVATVLQATDRSGRGATEEALARIAASLPDGGDAHRSVANLLRGMLKLSAADGEMAGISEVWASRVAGALEAGDLGTADDWMTAALEPGVSPADRRTLMGALRAAVGRPSLAAVATVLAEPPGDGAPGAVVARAAPLFAVDLLVEELAAEDRKSRRKGLLRALQVAARHQPAALLPHLADERWHVVRNAVVALGTSRWAEAAAALHPPARHGDHRVRIEALRALRRLDDPDAARLLVDRLADAHPAVRAEAGRLLGSLGGPGIDRSLIDATRSPDLDTALAATAALGWRSTGEARTALAALAGRRAWFGRARALRRAARTAQEAHRE